MPPTLSLTLGRKLPRRRWLLEPHVTGSPPTGKATFVLESSPPEGDAIRLGSIEVEVCKRWGRSRWYVEAKGDWKPGPIGDKHETVPDRYFDPKTLGYQIENLTLDLAFEGSRNFGVTLLQPKGDALHGEGESFKLVGRLEYGDSKSGKIESWPMVLRAHSWELTLSNNVSFTMMGGGQVKLYNDAHGSGNGNNCFEDMFAALQAAERFIYITDWSFWPDTYLKRAANGSHPADSHVGKLLKKKADAGVRVLVQIWHNHSKNTMGDITFDNDTLKFFKGSKVHCVATSPPEGGMISYYSHHQKTLICDAPDPDDDHDPKRKKVIAFIGGLDLTKGRWDTPEHALFSTHGGLHKGDWYNAEASDADHWPRQPWHDIHSRVEGPAAYDILENFEQRWKAQTDQDGLLIKWDNAAAYSSHYTHRGNWQVQVVRSIIRGATEFRPTEKGIQAAYVNAIQRAQRFVYIETQFFMGSSPYWREQRGAGLDHLVPITLARKIAAEITAGNTFCAYVLIPMYPEGDPSAGANQAMRRWQWNTIVMMYDLVTQALTKAKRKEKPTDFLRFLTLGQREPGHASDVEGLKKGSREYRLQLSKRHMIYIHSKLMIVDDRYILLGSANLNERSLRGDRDTEICIGALQEKDGRKQIKFGGQPTWISQDVHDFRKQLWVEHLGGSPDDWADPLDPKVRARVDERALLNWFNYMDDDEAKALEHGHLLPYPLRVSETGVVKAAYFPDCEGSASQVPGSYSSMIPNAVTG